MRQLAKQLPSQEALNENVLAGSPPTRVRSRICGSLADDFILVPRGFSIRQTVQGLLNGHTAQHGGGGGYPRRLAASKEGLAGDLWSVPKGFSVKRVKLLVQERQRTTAA